MKAKRKKILIIIAILGVTLITFIVLKVVEAIKKERDLAGIKMHLIYTISGEDSSLFSEAYMAHLKVNFAWNDIYRQVSFLFYNEQYEFILANADLSNPKSMRDLFHLRQTYSEETVMEPYKPEKLEDHGKFAFRLSPLKPIGNIFLNYSVGNIDTVIANDSLLQFHISCKNLSIRYAADSPVDLLLTGGNDILTEKLHLDIILVKHQTKIYFLFATPINYKNNVDPILANELLKD